MTNKYVLKNTHTQKKRSISSVAYLRNDGALLRRMWNCKDIIFSAGCTQLGDLGLTSDWIIKLHWRHYSAFLPIYTSIWYVYTLTLPNIILCVFARAATASQLLISQCKMLILANENILHSKMRIFID